LIAGRVSQLALERKLKAKIANMKSGERTDLPSIEGRFISTPRWELKGQPGGAGSEDSESEAWTKIVRCIN